MERSRRRIVDLSRRLLSQLLWLRREKHVVDVDIAGQTHLLFLLVLLRDHLFLFLEHILLGIAVSLLVRNIRRVRNRIGVILFIEVSWVELFADVGLQLVK